MEKGKSHLKRISRAPNVISRQRGKPLDEMMGNQLNDSIELKSAMEGLVYVLKRNLDKVQMEDDFEVVEEVMVV